MKMLLLALSFVLPLSTIACETQRPAPRRPPVVRPVRRDEAAPVFTF